ncbi:MAG TPA: substrate-binding domain-containing protein [Mycobacteriales bacterium]|nr:substrate-binding domain-containing protein [Mycobacteriales bacterium]
MRRVALASVAVLAAVSLAPASSHADTSSTVTVVGTSDVFDSDLIQQVITPDFKAANPQYSLNYVSLGTGAAISYAEAGTASALLVHAASLENAFVHPPPPQGSYSLEQYGRAIFYGDYVLLGPPSDPADVMSGSDPSHDVVGAFQKIAAAGIAGTADFVSRANTAGTAVQEHQIWALTDPKAVPGLSLCTISSGSNGGGEVPTSAANADPTTPCAAGPVTSIPYPTWYHETNLTQAPNIVAADACNFGNGNDCYTFTDRGTYDYLVSQGAISNLQVVGNDNSATATGGATLLVNSFHAYAINPAAFTSGSVHINTAGATAFLNWLTSPTGQADVTAYQADAPGGSTFVGDAAPTLTGAVPARSTAGRALTITGALKNKVPGTPALSGVKITLSAIKAGASRPVIVGTATTGANGKYSIRYKPTGDASYQVSSPAITKIEIPTPTLTPPFGDDLQPTATSIGASRVTGTATIATAKAKKGVVRIKGKLAPAVVGSHATLRVYAKHASASTKGPKYVKSFKLAAGATSYSIQLKLARKHTWVLSVHYVNTGQITTGVSPLQSVHVN